MTSLHRQLCDWIENTCTVTQGDGLGQPFKLMPWQRQFLRRSFAPECVESALSVGRGNGKSSLVAAIAAAAIVPGGPLVDARGETIIIASSLTQARVIFDHVLAMIEAMGLNLSERKVWKSNNSTSVVKLTHRPTGVSVTALGSDPQRAHGFAPKLILADEPAQWTVNRRDAMLAALRTSRGKIAGARLILLGTSSSDPSHFFSECLQASDRRRSGISYNVPLETEGEDLFLVKTIRAANPSWNFLPTLRKAVMAEASIARESERALQSYRSLRLNQAVNETVQRVLVEADVWVQAGETVPERAGRAVWGIDLGSGRSGSAITSVWPESGRAESMLCLPRKPSLAEREKYDQAPGGSYAAAMTAGHLILTGERSPDIAELIERAVLRFGEPVAIAADSWRIDELRDALEAADVDPLIRKRRMGFFHGSSDIESLRRLCSEGGIHPQRTALLDWSLSKSTVKTDDSGNAKMLKQRGDDLAVSLCLAAGLAAREPELAGGG